MDDSDLPSDVQLFLRDHIDSLEQLEILLLFQRCEQIWSAPGVAEELSIGASAAEEALRALCERGLLGIATEPSQFRYAPSSPALAAVVKHLAEIHADQRAALMKVLTANAIQRLRAGAVVMFSNPFLGRREK
jgi:hypothetical protein